MPRNEKKLVTAERLIYSLVQDINRARHRISIIAMVFALDESTQPLVDALVEAAKRGVHVTVAADGYTYAELSGRFTPSRRNGPRVRSATNLEKRLRAASIEFHWLGQSSITFFTGRTHLKWYVVDDIVYSFGGVNPYRDGLSNNDYMLRVHDAKLADTLDGQYRDIIHANTHGYVHNDQTIHAALGTIYIDGGFKNRSSIYRRACRLAEQASTISFVSQYCPSGKLQRILTDKQAAMYFNPWERASGFNRLIIRIGTFFRPVSNLYARAPYLHAKYMLFQMRDGSKVALTGSHNFYHAGVLFGTREVALETQDPEIVALIEKFHNTHVQ